MEKTVDLALKTAREREIRNIVFASYTGRTALYIAETGILDEIGFNIICVTGAYGFSEKGKNKMPEEIRNMLVQKGFKVLTTSHVLSGAERGILKKFGGIYPVEIMAHTLRMFSQGVKVGVEVSIMALDAGLIPYGVDVIAIGGKGKGADTALILRPDHANSIFDTKIHEIICKPR